MLTKTDPHVFQDCEGHWFYQYAGYTFGPFYCRTQAVDSFQWEVEHGNNHKNQGVWA